MMTKSILAIMMIAALGMTSFAYATNNFEAPERIGAQNWKFENNVFSDVTSKLTFPDESFRPSEGYVDTITAHGANRPESTQMTTFGVEGAYIQAYQNFVIAYLNDRAIAYVLVDTPQNSNSIEFDGDTVLFHVNGQVYAEGKYEKSDSEVTPFLKCSQKGQCALGVAKTTNER